MKTYNIKYRWLLLPLLLLFISCEDFLDRDPISTLPQQNMWQSTRDVEAGINDIYFNFRTTMRNNFFYWGEVRGDNFEVKTPGSGEMDKVIGNIMTSDLSSTLWTGLYNTINSANAAIKHIPNAEVSIEENKKNYLAQAYAMRALCYFYAIRVWGDVPVYLEPTEDIDNIKYSYRVPMKDVLRDVILSDLQQAELNIKAASRERKRISRYGIYAIMADVYLWLEDYEMAIASVDKFTSSLSTTGAYAFEASITNLSSIMSTDLNRKPSDDASDSDEYGNAKELLFLIHFNKEEWTTSSWIWTLFGGGTAGTLKLTEDFTNLFLATDRIGDQRAVYFAKDDGMVKYVPLGSSIPYTAWSECEMAYPVYRTTELYLIKAEAYARLSKWGDALSIIKENIRKRAAGSTLTNPIYTATKTSGDFADVEELVNYILDEKRIELVGEGKRWFDLVRTGRWKNLPKYSRTDGNGVTSVPEYQKLFPINFRHIDENPEYITQNPGY